MGSFSIWHWLIVLLVVVLIFGTKKLTNIGKDVGGAVKGFKDAMEEGKTSADATPLNTMKNGPAADMIEAEIIETSVVKVTPKKKVSVKKVATSKAAPAKTKAPVKNTTKASAAKKPASKAAADTKPKINP